MLKINKTLASCNGKIVPGESLRVPFTDRGFLFGDGVFTTMRVQEGRVENIERHLSRLKENCLFLNIIPPLINKHWIEELVTENKAFTGTWRLKLIITGGASRGLGFEERKAGDIIITLVQYTEGVQSFYDLTLFPFPISSPTAKIKSLAYLDRLWINDFARRNGTQDALTTMADGTILETAFSNIFWIRGGILHTPSFDLPLLKGTYLSSVLEGVKKLNMPVVEVKEVAENITLDSHVYICNSMKEIQPIDKIDQRVYERNKSLEETIRKATQEIISEDTLKLGGKHDV